MKRYFTADFHLGHQLLIEKGLRKFKSGDRMAEVLIKNANLRAKEDDLIIHAGDFVCYGTDRGIASSKISGKEYLKKLNADVILLEGNHDLNNHVRPHAKIMLTDIGPHKNVTIGHYPSWYDQMKGCIPESTSIHLCGHVHGEWKLRFDQRGILNINVGVDVWNNQIVSEDELIKTIAEQLKKLHNLNRK